MCACVCERSELSNKKYYLKYILRLWNVKIKWQIFCLYLLFNCRGSYIYVYIYIYIYTDFHCCVLYSHLWNIHPELCARDIRFDKHVQLLVSCLYIAFNLLTVSPKYTHRTIQYALPCTTVAECKSVCLDVQDTCRKDHVSLSTAVCALHHTRARFLSTPPAHYCPLSMHTPAIIVNANEFSPAYITLENIIHANQELMAIDTQTNNVSQCMCVVFRIFIYSL